MDVTGALALHDEVRFLRHKRHRAGRSAERIWRENRRKALRDSWRLNVASAALVAFCVFMIVFTDGFAELLMAAVIGAITTVHAVVWSLGGHVSSLSWMRGVWGEHDTEDVLDELGPGWVVEHDIARQWGNWDHVAVSRAGVFMIETKSSTAPATVTDDALRFGRRVAYPAGSFRGAAADLRDTLHRWTGQPPWVTAVVVIWGDFPQTEVAADRVTFINGNRLADWLAGQPPRLSSDRAAELARAVSALAARSRESAAA